MRNAYVLHGRFFYYLCVKDIETMTHNFKLSEFFTWPYRLRSMSQENRVKATNEMLGHVTYHHIEQAHRIATYLQDIRDDFADTFGDTPFFITCWLRSPAWERYRGRREDGEHTKGHTVDFVPAKWEKVHRDWMKERLKDWHGGFGMYSWGIHLDLGTKRRF